MTVDRTIVSVICKTATGAERATRQRLEEQNALERYAAGGGHPERVELVRAPVRFWRGAGPAEASADRPGGGAVRDLRRGHGRIRFAGDYSGYPSMQMAAMSGESAADVPLAQVPRPGAAGQLGGVVRQ